MKPWALPLPHFSAAELACRCCDTIHLDARMAAALVALRHIYSKPMPISSACRCPRHNTSVGGHPRSLHLSDNPKWPTDGAMAVDVRWREWTADRKLFFAQLAWSMGWSVGLHDGFCHLDRRADLKLHDLPQSVFVYGTWTHPFRLSDIMLEEAP